MVLITQKELNEIKEILPYYEDDEKRLIEKLINSYETLKRQNAEARKQKLMKKEEL